MCLCWYRQDVRRVRYYYLQQWTRAVVLEDNTLIFASPLNVCPKYVPCLMHATYSTYGSTAIMAVFLSLGAITVVAKSYGLALGCCVKRAGDGGSKTVFLAPPAQSCAPGADVVYDRTPAAPTRVGAAVRHVSKGSGVEEPPSKKTQSPLPMKTHTAIPTGINNQQTQKSVSSS